MYRPMLFFSYVERNKCYVHLFSINIFFIYPLICVFIHSLAFISGGFVCLFCSFIYYLLLFIHLFIDAFVIY